MRTTPLRPGRTDVLQGSNKIWAGAHGRGASLDASHGGEHAPELPTLPAGGSNCLKEVLT